ncbi:hypothetical protein ACFFMN_37905 [Planobispora siamensis]|uniref:Uncharacterized protein n=1 Tax=Planobispora siamensis TaxID=936338 RepID=A0A8J3SUZ1_9ACTN|nr:hypothetical protein [Planobispora siamensis]GIH96073.1 hypothetical protein Psi01_67030 [Planobispora siamensis]
MQESGKWRRTVRLVAAVLGGAVIAGIVVGVVARVLMRAILLVLDMPTSFTVGGTVAILVAFAVLAVPAAATATARPAIRHAGRWATAAVTGWGAAQNGIADAKALLLADDSQLPLLGVLTVAFAAAVVAHGRLAQYVTGRLAGPAATGARTAPLAETAPAS